MFKFFLIVPFRPLQLEVGNNFFSVLENLVTKDKIENRGFLVEFLKETFSLNVVYGKNGLKNLQL